MTKEQFAKEHGFESYNKMLAISSLIIFDRGMNYYVSPISNGWIAWVDKYPVKPIAWFESFELAQTFLVATFEKYAGLPEPFPLVSETYYVGGDY
ncbi:MAG: hypothetical protein ACYDEJ_12225 [Desulfitobacteriaceae bacterium]